ncbi:MAG: hypothetical protein A2577_00650 [Bdellovibrionales bacterium RIFOXYD1_FULL_36_51]|nr:MAG: hypothetical protein A2181_08305 [Bdellovibrionales bacterium RIFOXYA1_FULL_38_20]OFZ50152.1 MAG: hypothetical protein A2417_19135 [Bdellovibrionales bacterium RIFOXYC1_FULL_37_79]OFZ61356.1 MAG: hypothetical protein A2577_00650 [Bdellovibrionales bacterium RIFOXYD1_FULL_36_51]
MNQEVIISKIEKMIYILRGQKVMLDSDLAELYGVETKALNQAVKRNFSRFPSDFSYQCNNSDLESLRSQFVTANPATHWNYKRRVLPYVFSENGVAMLSSVLNSERAIQVNISIMRTFTKLRKLLASGESLAQKVDDLEKGTDKLFRIVFERLEVVEAKIPIHDPDRKKIGIKTK